MTWFGMTWFGMAWFRMAWFGMIWFGMIWFGMSLRSLPGCVPDFTDDVLLRTGPRALSLRSQRRTRRDVAGVPVRVGSDARSGTCSALACGGGAGGVQLGPGPGEGQPGAAGGREVLRPERRRPDP